MHPLKGIKPPNAGKGRVKGVPNRQTKIVKEAILAAFDAVGGHEYLQRVAREDPRTFCTLLGKVLPLQLVGDRDNPVYVHTIERRIVRASTDD